MKVFYFWKKLRNFSKFIGFLIKLLKKVKIIGIIKRKEIF